MPDTAVSIAGLSFAYQPGRWILRDCNAAVGSGQIFSILGPNGCGKTTLLKLMLGALTPSEGHLATSGRTAFVPQLFQVSFDYTALDMVLMGRARQIGLFSQPAKHDEAAALEALDRLGMADFARRPFHELSGGQRQLVILSRALAAQAEILILDEPTSALDLKNQALVLEWITRLSCRDGLTIIFTTHHPHHALTVSDASLLMLGPERYVVGPANEVMTEDNLAALYGVPLKRLTFEHGDHSVETFVPVLQLRSAPSRPGEAISQRPERA